jgi:hypothetical protein
MREAKTRDYRRNWAKGGSNYKRKEEEETEGEKQGEKEQEKAVLRFFVFLGDQPARERESQQGTVGDVERRGRTEVEATGAFANSHEDALFDDLARRVVGKLDCEWETRRKSKEETNRS